MPLDADSRRLADLLPIARKLTEICLREHGSDPGHLAPLIQEYASQIHEAAEAWEWDWCRHRDHLCDPEACDWCADEARHFGGPEYEPTLSAEQRNAGASL